MTDKGILGTFPAGPEEKFQKDPAGVPNPVWEYHMTVVLAWSDQKRSAPPVRSDLTAADPSTGRAPGRPAPRHFRPGRFGFLWGANAASSLGDGLALVAFPLLATRVTHDPLLIAGVAVATRLPWLLLSLPLGALADRVDRRRLLMIVELTRMAVLVGLGLLIATGRSSIFAIYATSFILGAFQILFIGATQAVIPEMVARDGLARANGRLYAAQTSGEQFVGPAVGGLAFAAMASLPFLADGLSFAASAGLLLLALPRRAQWSTVSRTGRGRISADIIEGARWFARHRILRLAAGLVATFAFCQAMGLAILVVYGLRVLHLTGAGFGLFMATGAVGNLGGAMVAARVVKRVGTGRVLVIAGIVAGLSFIVISRASTVPLALAALIVEAICVGVGNVASVTLRQSLIPTALAGRVQVIMRTCTYGAMTLGALAGGIVASGIGPHSPFAIGGAIQIAGTVAIGLPLARRLVADHALTIDLDPPETVDVDVDPWISSGTAIDAPVDLDTSEVA